MIRGNGRTKSVLLALPLLIFALLGASVAQAGDGAMPVDEKTDAVDLALARNPIAAQRREISVQGPGEKAPAVLQAKGAGPVFHWSLFSFQNSSDKDLSFVLAFEPQGFAGSGLLSVAPAGPNVLGAVLTRDSSALPFTQMNGARLVTLSLAAKETKNIAVESVSPDLAARLWQPASFQAAQGSTAYFRGLVEGVIALVLAGILAAYAFRPNRATLAGFCFALSGAMFLETDSGLIASALLATPGLAPVMQATALSLMATTLALCAMAFLHVKPHRSLLGASLAGAVALGLANLAYGMVEPLVAGAIARFGLLAVTVAGFGASWWLRGKRPDLVDRGLLLWSALFCWVLLAGIVAESPGRGTMLSPLLGSGLVAVLLCLAMVLLRNIFQQGLSSRPFITEANLRSLALSAGRHSLWDWQPAASRLTLGPELAKSLDLQAPGFSGNARNALVEILHPLDVDAYHKLVERHSFKPGERLHMELRLRNGAGVYQWFELKAQAIVGPGNSIDRCLGTLTDISSLKQVEERLSSDALQDTVTNLPNKALFLDRLERAMGKLNALPLRVIMVDLDRFKILNEGLGQEVGDRILKITAKRLSDLLEPEETAARLAGSQFALLCQETIDRGDFSNFLRTIEAAVAAPIKHGQQHVVITASIGLSASSKEGGKAQDLLDQANVAMLDARADGGARAASFHSEMKDERAKLLSLESDLRRASENGEIEIYYQPIVYLHSLEVSGFEALARWRHPKLGLLSPSEFLEVAETAGMMKEIGQFMMAGAARQLGIWQRLHRRGREFFVSVNVSASQLMHPDFPRQVKHILDRENLDPGSLKLEITETLIMRQPERAALLLQQMQAMGVGLACDDFGTGFSSLASLRDFPFDTLKIDRSFLAPDGLDEKNAKIIRSITSLAGNLGMLVVAEGIETQAQIDQLAELGCGLGQGYLLGRPEPAEAAGKRLTQAPVMAPASAMAPASPPSLFQPLAPPTPGQLRSLYSQMPSLAPSTPNLAPLILPEPAAVEEAEAEELPSIFTLTEAKVKPKAKAKPSSPKKPARKKRR
ncbi:MAG: EAL domain-containing protein [Alphaproteobacteria bacterium]|nr:EAL domain-containing protein [Alphaproteobacteria bacterium]